MSRLTLVPPLPEHRVTVKAMWRETPTGERIQYKWRFDCACGAGGISWSWWRQYDAEAESGMTLEEWLGEQGVPLHEADAYLDSGALPMALDHLREKHAEAQASA